MWNPGDIVTGRGIYRERIWHAVPSIVISDTAQEIVTAIIPGSECMVEENYARGIKNGKRRWDFKYDDWRMEKFVWHTNHVLSIVEPGRYYSIMLFWNHSSNRFLGYYANFQVPFRRRPYGFDTLDLDLDLDISPDLTFKWKDEDDYQKAIEHGLISPEWMMGIENARLEILERLEKRQYPFDGSWLDWKPDPGWQLPKLPENWDKI